MVAKGRWSISFGANCLRSVLPWICCLGDVLLPTLANHQGSPSQKYHPIFPRTIIFLWYPKGFVMTPKITIPRGGFPSSHHFLTIFHQQSHGVASGRQVSKASFTSRMISVYAPSATKLVPPCALGPWETRVDRQGGGRDFPTTKIQQLHPPKKPKLEPPKLVICRCFSFSKGVFSGYII